MANFDIDTISLDFYLASKRAFLQQVKDSDQNKPYYFIKKSVFIETFSDEFQKTCRSLEKQYSLEASEIQDILLPKLNEQSATPIISTTPSFDASKIKDSIQSYVRKYSTEIVQKQFNRNSEKKRNYYFRREKFFASRSAREKRAFL